MPLSDPLAIFGRKVGGRNDFRKQFSRYRSTVFWLYKTLFRFNKLKLIFTFGANICGATLRGAALSLLVVYAGYMEGNRSFELLGKTFVSRDPEVFILVVACLGLLILASGVLVYVGGRSTITLAVEFASYCSRLILIFDGARPTRNTMPSAGAYPDRIFVKANNMLATARAVQPLLQISNPATMVLYSLAAVIYLNPLITAGIAAIIILSLVIQYLINFHAAQNEKNLSRSRGAARSHLRHLFDKYAYAGRIFPSSLEEIEQEFGQQQVSDFQKHYAIRKLAARRSRLVSDVVFSASAMLVFVLLGLSALEGETTWALFLGYIVFARILLAAVRGLLGGITRFARHYSGIREIYELLTSKKPMESLSFGEILLKARGSDKIGDYKKRVFEKGQALNLITAFPVSRFNIFAITRALGGPKTERSEELRLSCQFVADATEVSPGGNLAELIESAHNPESGIPENRASCLQVSDLPSGGETSAETRADSWQDLSLEERSRLLLSQVSTSKPGLVVVERALLESAGDEFVQQWRDWLGDSFIVVRYPPGESVDSELSETVLALGQDGSTALMSAEWLQSNEILVPKWLQRHQAKETFAADDDEDDD